MQMDTPKLRSLLLRITRLSLVLVCIMQPPGGEVHSWVSFRSNELRKLTDFKCYWVDWCCTRDLLQCFWLPEACPAANVCTAGEEIGFYTGAKSVFTHINGCTPVRTCNAMGSAIGDPARYTLKVPAWSFTHTSFRDATPATYQITSSYTEVMTFVVNATDNDLCPHIHCRIRNTGGVDQTACINTIDEFTGQFEINTAGCTAIGTGNYKYECTTAMPWAISGTNTTGTGYVSSPAFSITINDRCNSPNVLTSLKVADHTYE